MYVGCTSDKVSLRRNILFYERATRELGKQDDLSQDSESDSESVVRSQERALRLSFLDSNHLKELLLRDGLAANVLFLQAETC
jgi:hypothetical protein